MHGRFPIVRSGLDTRPSINECPDDGHLPSFRSAVEGRGTNVGESINGRTRRKERPYRRHVSSAGGPVKGHKAAIAPSVAIYRRGGHAGARCQEHPHGSNVPGCCRPVQGRITLAVGRHSVGAAFKQCLHGGHPAAPGGLV